MKTNLQLALVRSATPVAERLVLVAQERVGQSERGPSQNLARGFKSFGGGWQPPADKNTKAAMLR